MAPRDAIDGATPSGLDPLKDRLDRPSKGPLLQLAHPD